MTCLQLLDMLLHSRLPAVCDSASLAFPHQLLNPLSTHHPGPCTLPAAVLQGKGASGAAGAAGEEGREPSQLDLLLGRLPGCVSKELADELAVNFCYGQVGCGRVGRSVLASACHVVGRFADVAQPSALCSVNTRPISCLVVRAQHQPCHAAPDSAPLQNKGARKRLARALTTEMPAGALALLPFYARTTATLAQVFPDVSTGRERKGVLEGFLRVGGDNCMCRE